MAQEANPKRKTSFKMSTQEIGMDKTFSKKTSKDYNSTGESVTYHLKRNYPNEYDPQKAYQEIEKIIDAQHARRSAEGEVKAVFTGAQNSGTPQTPNKAPSPIIPRTNGSAPSSNSEWNVVSQKQIGFLYFQAKDQGKEHDLKNLYKDMGIITTKDKNNMTKAQLKEVKAWLGVE